MTWSHCNAICINITIWPKLAIEFGVNLVEKWKSCSMCFYTAVLALKKLPTHDVFTFEDLIFPT